MKCRKLLAILLALVMVIGLLPFAALADGSQDNQLDYIQGTDPDPVGDPGIDPGVDPDIQPDTDLNIDPDGEPDGNLVLQVPDTEPEHKNHGADGKGTITETWQAWDPTETRTISRSGYYYLDEDFESINQKITIDADDVHLCLNGHEMSDSGANPGFITVKRDASLTICDCSKGETGGINYNCKNWYAYAIVNNGALTLYSGKIYSEVGNGIDIINKGGSNVKFDMEGGTIDVGGTGILFFSGDAVNINGGTLTYGGETGVTFGAKGTLTVSGGTIRPRENGASESQGISRNDAGALYVTDGNISGKQYGIRFINAGDGEVEISGGNISASGEKGYGIYLNKSAKANLYLRDTPTISGQKAALYIGKPNAVYASKNGRPYKGDNLTVAFTGNDTEAPIILDVNDYNDGNFTLVFPEDKTLVRQDDNLVLGVEAPVYDHYHGVDGTDTDPQTWQPWTQATDLSSITSGYYYLTANITHDGMVIIESGADVHICLNGQTMTQSVLYVGNNASVTICDCKDNGEIIGGSTGALMLNGGSTVNFYSGTISSEATDAVNITLVTAEAQATFNMYGGTINSKKMGISNNGGIVNVYGGTILFDDYAGVFNGNDRSVATIAGGTIQPQEDAARGDNGVYVSKGTLYLTGDAEISGLKGDIKINNPNAVYASNGDAAYSGDLLNIYFSGGATVTEPIILDVTNDNADLFELVWPLGKALVRDSNNNLVLGTKPVGHQNHDATGKGSIPEGKEWIAWDGSTQMNAPGYYYLDKDVTLTSTIEVTADVHLCLNGYAMSDNGRDADFNFITVNQDASLTICDCSEGETGTINYNCTTGYAIVNNAGYAIVNNGALTLYSGKIYSEVGNGIFIINKGGSNVKFDMEDGTIDVGGTGILFSSGNKVNINGGTLIYGGQTGVLFGAKGTLTVSGGTIQPRENGASESRGISRTDAGDLYVTDGNISGKQNGIRIINAGDGEVEISGGNISASGEKGYGIYLYETATANLYLSNDPTISGQKADLYIGKPNKVYAGKETAAYNGSALDIYYAGDAATEDPIILNVTEDNANSFNLNYPTNKTLERRSNNLYLADKILPMPALTVTVDPNPLTYGQTAQATVSGEPSGASISYEIIESEPAGVASIGTDGAITTNGVGKFKVKVTVSATGYSDGEATSAEITVNKATPTPEAPTGLTATYGDTLEDIDLPTGWTWNAPNTSVGNKGTNVFEATYLDPSGYYNPVTKMLSVVVNAKTITDAVVVLGAYPTYDGTQKTQTITSVTVDGTVLTAGSDYTVTGNTGTEAKEYTLTITGTGNYSGTKEVTWYIQKAIPGVTAPTIRTLTYTGTAQALLNPGNTEQGTMVYSLQETEGYSVDIPKKTDAGTYDVWYKVLGYDGYQNTNPVKLQVTIKKAPLTVTADDIWVYAGNTPKFTATIKGYVNGEDWRVLKGELTFTCGYSQKYSKPGSRYTITPKGLTADNYDITFKTGTLTVKDPLSPRFNVYVLDSKHGTVEADCRYARKGDVVTLTIKPDWGYELETLTVTDSHGYELKLTYHSNGTYTFTMPRDNVTVKAIFTVRDMPFVDVPGDAWYAGGVRYVYAHGLMNGTGNWRFSPNRTTTRAMIATILYRMEGSPRVYGTSQFGDVEAGSWYEDAVIWATQNDIVEGYTSKTFGPDDPITREQMAAMLYRYADYCRCDMSAGRYVDLSKYSDMNEISDYAIPALRWAVGEEIIQGRTGKRLAPTDTATRAEVAVMLMRFCEDVIW